MTYNVNVRRLQGGNVLEVVAGGEIRMNGGTITANGTQAATIADTTAITGGESPTEAEHNALVTKINAILAALEGAGILASS